MKKKWSQRSYYFWWDTDKNTLRCNIGKWSAPNVLEQLYPVPGCNLKFFRHIVHLWLSCGTAVDILSETGIEFFFYPDSKKVVLAEESFKVGEFYATIQKLYGEHYG